MNNRIAKTFLFLTLLYFCQNSARAQLEAISREHRYTTEICYDPSQRFMAFNTTKPLQSYDAKIIFKEEAITEKRFAYLVGALKRHTPRDKGPRDIHWSILIMDDRGKEICTCCLDAWGVDGYINGVAVTFANDTGKWLRKYLSEAFDLKDDPIGTAPVK